MQGRHPRSGRRPCGRSDELPVGMMRSSSSSSSSICFGGAYSADHPRLVPDGTRTVEEGNEELLIVTGNGTGSCRNSPSGVVAGVDNRGCDRRTVSDELL